MCKEQKQKYEKLLEEYKPSLNTSEVAEALNCCHRTAFSLQSSGKLPSYILDQDSQKKIYKTTKVDLIEYMINNQV